MTIRERMLAVLSGRAPDRLPMVEWASWWDKTVDAWRASEPGIPSDKLELFDYWGLDRHFQFWLPNGAGLPHPAYHGAGIIRDEAGYEAILPLLYPEKRLAELHEGLLAVKAEHERGDAFVWYTLEGFFWFPRTLFGIENHLFAFYDAPELMLRMNRDAVSYYKKAIDVIYSVLTPEFMTIAEDMSYNHGPMLSRELFDRFVAPFYHEIILQIKRRGTRVLVDTDGFLEPMIPWLHGAGVEGVLPLERQSGVDVNRIRRDWPDWIMLGGFDKTVMHLGEAAMRAEFLRLLPAIRSGRFVPSVDHQTPPDVSPENYRAYVRLLAEYSHMCGEQV